mgnify:FL=1|tara:strand:+ start:1424 stop:1813 length:390 start_codon:yes stop_codon:yes gene_type:complete
MEAIDWEKYPNFKASEFACRHCGKEGIQESIVAMVQEIRQEVGFPFIITSGYRCSEHPIEKRKSKAGAHADGLAADISCSHAKAYKLVQVAMAKDISGIGIKQKGDGRFIHLDVSEQKNGRPRPHIWSY